MSLTPRVHIPTAVARLRRFLTPVRPRAGIMIDFDEAQLILAELQAIEIDAIELLDRVPRLQQERNCMAVDLAQARGALALLMRKDAA